MATIVYDEMTWRQPEPTYTYGVHYHWSGGDVFDSGAYDMPVSNDRALPGRKVVNHAASPLGRPISGVAYLGDGSWTTMFYEQEYSHATDMQPNTIVMHPDTWTILQGITATDENEVW